MKYLNARVDDSLFQLFNTACVDLGRSKKEIINRLVSLFIETKEEVENKELGMLAKRRYEQYKQDGKSYSLNEIKAFCK